MAEIVDFAGEFTPATGTPTLQPVVAASPLPTSTETATSVPPPATVKPAATEPASTAQAPTATPISVGHARATTAAELADAAPPLRDEIALAAAYRGLPAVAPTPKPFVELEPGITETFYISNVDSNIVTPIEAQLMSVGENAYFWFDLRKDSVQPDIRLLADLTASFDEIYDTLYPYFGVATPDGGRVHIVHASPAVLCDDPNRCSLAGYFSSRDLLPLSIDPQSNEREMFVMNSQTFGSSTYLDTLSHELRHLLGNSYDLGEEDWFIEGAAMLSEDLVGYTVLPQIRANQFLTDPDLQLNSWPDDSTGPHYGKGYLLNRFIYERLGSELYREFSLSPVPGLAAIDEIAAKNDLGITGNDVWLDWLVAMALQDDGAMDEAFRWGGPALEEIAAITIDNLPVYVDTTVSQYAADYYEMPSSGSFRFQFQGDPVVPLLNSAAPSGDFYWYAQRANTSNPRLTRAFDLTDATEATLLYTAYVDIEQGYDFAYVSVSTDGGQSWQALTASGMQGLDPVDDPSDSALTSRFYTGRLGRWVEESVDLSAYLGQEILVRFEYVTDLMVTYGGFAVDDILIDGIGYHDDVETLDTGWIAEGFVRVTGELPQTWWLQLVTFDSDGRPSVERHAVPDNGQQQLAFVSSAGDRRPILIVSAIAPDTLQSAPYQLSINSQ